MPRRSRPVPLTTAPSALAASRVAHHFAADRPKVEEYERLVAAAAETTSHEEHARSLLGERRMGWTGYYVVLYSDEKPTHLGIFGSSGD